MTSTFCSGPLKLERGQKVYVVCDEQALKMYFFNYAHDKCVLKLQPISPEISSIPCFFPADEVHLTEKDALRCIKKALEAQMKELEQRHFAVSQKLTSSIMKEIGQDSDSPAP